MMGRTEAACCSAAQTRLEMLADALSLVLSHQRHDADRETVGIGHIGSHELDTAISQGKKESRIPRQPIQPSDHQFGTGLPTLI